MPHPEARPPLHPSLAPLAGLVGAFEGDGEGDYPTIEPFRYRERVTFEPVGKPFLVYRQRTWRPDDGQPLHTEVGYLRLPDDPDPGGAGRHDDRSPVARRAELLLAQPTGIVEVHEGTLAAGVLRLRTTTVGRTATAKAVHAVRREFQLDGDVLTYDLWMAYADVPETHHLHAELQRIA